MQNNLPNQQNSRREFVKQGGIITSGIIAAPLMSNANYFSGANDVIKIALIGCGGRGTGAALQALQSKQNVKLVAMADAFRDRLDSCYKNITAEDLSDAGVKGSVKSMIDVPEERKFVGFDAYLKAIPLADVVILATPPGFRPIHFEEAVNQGKHIFYGEAGGYRSRGCKKSTRSCSNCKIKKTECSSWTSTALSEFIQRTV